jgi:hypothetical protein
MVAFRFVFVLFLLLPLSGLAQNRFVAFDPPGKKRIYYSVGDEIRLRFEGEKSFTSWLITSVTDSGFVVEGRHFVKPERVSGIHVYPRRPVRMLKRLLLYGGAGLPILMVANYALNPSDSRIFIPTVAGISGGMLASWLILKSFDWAGIKYKVSSERPLKMLILDLNPPAP